VSQAKRVLVIDDNVDHAQVMMLLLRGMGHDAAFAVNGSSALDMARRFRPDIVLVDLGLPDMDGALLCRELRSQPGLERARIFAISGSVFSAARSYSWAASHCRLHAWTDRRSAPTTSAACFGLLN
jgi:CheY-like chemotaxis protein